MPRLSLVLCSRNDGYAGNSLWRLETALNYVARQVRELDRQESVEVLVSDWGSQLPLREALGLTPEAGAITRFVEVPPALAREKQQDSPFAEVFANNAAIRRASGDYIGRIDQGTLVGKRFLKGFLAMAGGTEPRALPMASSFLFVGRRRIPLGFALRSYPLETVNQFVDAFADVLPREGRHQAPWFDAPAGAVILHRELWSACRGYDERLLYWGFLDADLALRVGLCHGVFDLEPEIGCDFYHLTHSKRRFRITTRRKNKRERGVQFAPNGEDWGLIEHPLAIREATPSTYLACSAEELLAEADLPFRYRVSVGVDRVWETALAIFRAARGGLVGDRVETNRLI